MVYDCEPRSLSLQCERFNTAIPGEVAVKKVIQLQTMCASTVDGQIGYVMYVVVICVLYREAVRETSGW